MEMNCGGKNLEIIRMPYISKTALSNYLDKNYNTLRNSIAYWKKIGKLKQLKRGFYVFANFLNQGDNSRYYSRFLATKMIEPSYLSMETVLQDYQMLTDVVYGYSVVTIKKTYSIKNDFGTFNYQSIKSDLFKGFREKSYGKMKWYVASKAKALFDYIYFNQNKFQNMSKGELEGLRLNLEVMTEEDWQEYKEYLENASKKMEKIYELMSDDILTSLNES